MIRFLNMTRHCHWQFLFNSILQQLQRDQTHTVTPDKSQFRSLSDAVQRLLSYHVCQGSMPTEEDLKKGKQAGPPECHLDTRHPPRDALLGTHATGEPEPRHPQMVARLLFFIADLPSSQFT